MKKAWLWILAFVLTMGMAIYQRMTGPTYPLKGQQVVDGLTVSYDFGRSHAGPGDQEVTVFVEGTSPITALLKYRRYKTDDQWTAVPMKRIGDNLAAYLPHQPPAGKLIYFVELTANGQTTVIPKHPVVTRFKGEVPIYWLLPHVVIMFIALLLAVRTGLGLLAGQPVNRLVRMTFWFLLVGGLFLGPVVQKHAFGEFWTGIPFGWDLTDNKTLIAFVFWAIAMVATRREKRGRLATAVAVVVMLSIYLIPHSLFGSELDYESGSVVTGQSPVKVAPVALPPPAKTPGK